MRRYFVFYTIAISLGIFVGSCFTQKTSPKTPSFKNIPTKQTPLKSAVQPDMLNNNFAKISNSDFVIDLRYSTDNNIANKILYSSNNAYLQKNTLDKLKNANNDFLKLGYRIKIWDAYRPFEIQKILWNIVPNANFIANPNNKGSNHNRGSAVDITLVDLNGKELDMPTDFDDFSGKAHRTTGTYSQKQQENVDTLTNIMLKHGFSKINTEWWHFDDTNSHLYEITNLQIPQD